MTTGARLRRSYRDRMFPGVAGGMADYFDIDPIMVRLAWVVFCFVTAGTALLLYIALAIIIPNEPKARAESSESEDRDEEWAPDAADGRSGDGLRNALGAVLIVVGGIFLLSNFGLFDWLRWDLLLPVILIGVGAALVIGRARRWSWPRGIANSRDRRQAPASR